MCHAMLKNGFEKSSVIVKLMASNFEALAQNASRLALENRVGASK